MQASTITRNVLRNHWLPVSPAMIAAWWPGASFPLALSLQLVVGDARGVPLAASIKKKAQTRGRAGFALQAPGRLPLPVGTAVLRFKKTGPASLEMHVRLPGTALPAGRGSGGGNGPGGGAAAPAASAAPAATDDDDGGTEDCAPPLAGAAAPPVQQQLVTEEETNAAPAASMQLPAPSGGQPPAATTGAAGSGAPAPSAVLLCPWLRRRRQPRSACLRLRRRHPPPAVRRRSLRWHWQRLRRRRCATQTH